MLIFPIDQLPKLSKGKGNKIIGISPSKLQLREEFMVAVTALSPEDSLMVYSGKRHLTLKLQDLEHYYGERGRKGNKLPRGFQKVDRIVAEIKVNKT